MGIDNTYNIKKIEPEEFTDLFKADPILIVSTDDKYYQDEIDPEEFIGKLKNIHNYMFWLSDEVTEILKTPTIFLEPFYKSP